jgi:PAS domain S-box-containing protein
MKECNRRNEEHFKHLIKNSFDMMVLLDAEGIQRYVSESCEYILGYKPEELTDVPVIDTFLHPDDREKAREGLRDIVENNKNGGTQYRHRHKNGDWVYLETFGTNQLENPEVGWVVLNVRDITERKQIEQALKESEARLSKLNATKDRLFSIISHDLKSPFNSIMGFSQLLVEQIHRKDYEGVDHYARIIQNSSQRAMDLLTNLLEWSRTQTGNIEFNPAYIELVTLIQETMDLLSDSAEQKSVTLSGRLPHHLPVLADKAMIETILRNLISNGIKFTRAGGSIVISAIQTNEYVKVSVSDDGIGIGEEDIQRLFRPETHLSTLGTSKEKGTGLGLLLCKEFIDMHEGNIWADSKPDKGSTFCFTIPNGQ